MPAITIIIADSTDVGRDRLQGLISENPSEYQLLYTSINAQNLLQQAPLLQAHIIIIELGLPGMNSPDLCHQLRQVCPQTKIIGRCADDIAFHARRLLKAGAHGMLLKEESKAEIKRCLNWVHDGNFYLGQGCSHLLASKLRDQKELNPFECDVLQLIFRGMSNKQIAARLYSSTSKVKRAREQIKRLSGASSPYDLIRWATHEGYVSLKECWGL